LNVEVGAFDMSLSAIEESRERKLQGALDRAEGERVRLAHEVTKLKRQAGKVCVAEQVENGPPECIDYIGNTGNEWHSAASSVLLRPEVAPVRHCRAVAALRRPELCVWYVFGENFVVRLA
jgi:hypothetical protein